MLRLSHLTQMLLLARRSGHNYSAECPEILLSRRGFFPESRRDRRIGFEFKISRFVRPKRVRRTSLITSMWADRPPGAARDETFDPSRHSLGRRCLSDGCAGRQSRVRRMVARKHGVRPWRRASFCRRLQTCPSSPMCTCTEAFLRSRTDDRLCTSAGASRDLCVRTSGALLPYPRAGCRTLLWHRHDA